VKKILLVTNDFPPRVGGIQSYLWKIYDGLAAGGADVTVLAPAFPGDTAFDANARMRVERWPGGMAWPSPALNARVASLAKQADIVTFGALLPLDVVARKIDRPVVLHTHGFEVAWARAPLLRQTFRRIGRASAAVTVVSEFTRRAIARALGGDEKLHMLKTGVDLERFSPAVNGDDVRKRLGLDARPLVSCVSRLVARKGQDRLIDAMPIVRRDVPDAALLITGRGPGAQALRKRAQGDPGIVFAGEVSEADLAAHYAAGDVFAMPCRSRYAGMEVEGLGLVYLEAQACARPAIAGDSGGAPEAVVPGETGYVVPGRDTAALAASIVRLLSDPPAARAMGAAGRRFVEEHHRWEDVVARTRAILDAL
jgi:phosphatidylinositol alpha-1,6-mannosyltransferase